MQSISEPAVRQQVDLWLAKRAPTVGRGGHGTARYGSCQSLVARSVDASRQDGAESMSDDGLRRQRRPSLPARNADRVRQTGAKWPRFTRTSWYLIFLVRLHAELLI